VEVLNKTLCAFFVSRRACYGHQTLVDIITLTIFGDDISLLCANVLHPLYSLAL